MTHEDLKRITALQTASIAEACKDETTLIYVLSCLQRFYSGDWGEVCEEDKILNDQELKDGRGHVLARYGKLAKLSEDIYIEAMINADHFEDTNYNYTMIMYRGER